MKKLILIRHAKSDWHSAAATDFDRPLNARGKKAAPLMGEQLAARSSSPDLLLSSPAKRARQTAKKIARQIAYPETEIRYDEGIYEASLTTLVKLIHRLADRCDSIILIGHNPGFSELGKWLTPEAPDWLPTCGLLELELPIDNWAETTQGCATLQQYNYPKQEK